MRSILISIKPKWLAKILNGEKTIEIRKTCPAIFKHLHSYEGASLDVYFYCTKEEELFYNRDTQKWYVAKNRKNIKRLSNGVVKAKFTLNKVEKIEPFEEYDSPMGLAYKLTEKKIITCQKAQLTYDEYNRYLKGKTSYAWHIDNLVIFDKPKELNDFLVKSTKRFFMEHSEKTYCILGKGIFKDLTKAPQSWCYIESEE